MAEAFELGSSIFDVLEIAGSVIKACYNYQDGARKAPKESRRIREQLIGLRAVLERLQILEGGGGDSEPDLGLLKTLLSLCFAELEGLKKRLEPKHGLQGLHSALRWPLNEGETEKTLNRLEQLKTTILMALLVDHTKLARDISSGLRDVLESFALKTGQLDERMPEIDRWEVIAWVDAPDTSSNHRDARKKQQSGTCTWFLDGDVFNKWTSQGGSFIWVHGIAGSGKTVLCALIADCLKKEYENMSKAAVISFYVDFSDIRKRFSGNVFRSFITQLTALLPDIPPSLLHLYFQCRNAHRQPTLDELRDVFKDVLELFDRVYIVIDALDECVDREELLALLEDMSKWEMNHVRILVTSRTEWDIGERLEESWQSWHSVDMNVTADIHTHVTKVLKSDKAFQKFPEEIRSEVKDVLIKRANGMFRWVNCQLDDLRKCSSINELRKALKSLPKTLDETYARVLDNIDEGKRHKALRLLQWLAFSARPMAFKEVVDAVAINLEDSGAHFDPDDRLLDPQDLLLLCPSLVTMSSPATQSVGEVGGVDDKTLSLAHFTVKEYLMSNRIQNTSLSFYSLDESVSHASISEGCLVYLMQFNEKIGSKEGIQGALERCPLTRYAAQFWMKHAGSCTIGDHKILEELIMRFLQPQDAAYQNWPQFYDMDAFKDSPPDWWEVYAPLYYSSMAGLELICRRLLENGADANMYEGYYGYPLQAAAVDGHDAVVRLLVEHGAEVNARGGEFGHALQAAAVGDNINIVQFLLEHDADVGGQGGYYGTALQAAAFQGSTDIVQLLLDRGADVNARCGKYCNALLSASFSGHKDTVQLLVDRGADVNARNWENVTALRQATYNGHLVVVQLLLDRGADANAQCGRHSNALLSAAFYGHYGIVQLLLDRGADANTRNLENITALRQAAYNGHIAIVQLLLDRGADIHGQCGKYSDALQSAAFNGHKDIVQLLLDRGADANTRSWENITTLRQAAYNGHLAVVQLLLDRGADVNAQCGKYTDALQSAAFKGHRDVVQLLLDHGADINARDSENVTALRRAAQGGNLAIVQLLLDRGADVNVQCEEYSLALLSAASNGYKDIVELFLDRDVDVDSRYLGITALRQAAYNGRLAVMQLLLDRGADANGSCGKYWNALQSAAFNGHKDVVQLLVDRGADVNTQTWQNVTPLRQAAYNGHLAVVQLLLDRGADINAQCGKHSDALVSAASNGHRDVVKLLLDRSADINARDSENVTTLRQAAYNGHLAVVQLLLDRGADVNAQCGKYWNTLQSAASNGHIDIVQLLLDHGADVNSRDCENGAVLRNAAGKGHLAIVQLLLDRGADVNAQCGKSADALQVAVIQGHKDVVELLLDRGADVNARDWEDDTALRVTAWKGHLAIAKLLLDRGADVNAQCGRYESALRTAISEGSKDMVQLLLERGADEGLVTDLVDNTDVVLRAPTDDASPEADHEETSPPSIHNDDTFATPVAHDADEKVALIFPQDHTNLNGLGGFYGKLLRAAILVFSSTYLYPLLISFSVVLSILFGFVQ